MLIINSPKTPKQRYILNHNQLDLINFESPLQQVLQEHAALLRLLNQQHKWQIWISARPMLKRFWIKQSGLNERKIVHFSNIEQVNIVTTVEKALLSGTASYIVACIDHMLTINEKNRLQNAVKMSGTHLFLIDDNYLSYNDFMTMSLTVNNIH